MSSLATCSRCGAPLHAQTLGGLCPGCVGRGLLHFASRPDDPPAEESASAAPSPEGSTPPSQFEPDQPRIPGFRLGRELGEGGFGVVYLAEQLAPVKRQVALKVVKLGMDTRQVVARFEAERQALALMDHPGIAKVFDAGATESGRPYFVMEFVEGLPITQYADERGLSIVQRLELFTQVCEAVQHAHQKGVIHRDLKPSNILVGERDGQTVPKVIDFGLAKATHVELTDKTLITHFQQLLGTPAYMSPEQVEMGAVDVDTRSDIYALGVLLYELLTGRTPFNTQELLSGGMGELSRRIREQEPPKPSTRLLALSAEELDTVARQRASAPEKIGRQVRGDLDWIVMKALAKDRTRRYATANGLAMDIQRHLRSEPVSARPPTALDHFEKLVRRNKLAMGAVCAVALALLTGLSIATMAFVKERQARRETSAKAEESRQRLVRLNVATGNKLVEDGDYFNALLWFVEALRLDEGHRARADAHRRRIGVMLRSAPRLSQIWFHDSLARGAAFSPNDDRVVTISWDHKARVWDARTGALAVPPLRHTEDLEDGFFTPDGQRLVLVDTLGQAGLWDVATGQRLGPPLPTDAGWAAFALSPDGRWLLTGATNGIQLFDATNATPTGPVIPIPFRVRALGFSPDSRSAVVGGVGRDALLLELPSGQIKQQFRDTAGLRGVAFTPDGGRVATMSLWELRIWDLVSGELALPVLKPGGHLFDCDYSPDGRHLVVASWGGFARVFDAATGQPIGTPMRHHNSVTRANLSADGRWVATTSQDGTARVWHPETGEPASPPLPHSGYVYSAVFSRNSARLVTASQDRTVRLWELQTNRSARLVLRHSGGVTKAQFNRDGTRLLTMSFDKFGRIWNAHSGVRLVQFQATGRVMHGSFSPDGQLVVLGAEDGAVSVWDAQRAVQRIPPVRHQAVVTTTAWSSDGRRILTASADGRARVWWAHSGEAAGAWLAHSNEISHAAFSPDGSRVVTAGLDTIAQIWDATSGTPIGSPMKHICGVSWASFSPDGRRVVTAATDRRELPRSAQVWDAATGLPTGSPMRHQDGITHVEFSPNGRHIVTSGEDDCAMVWDSATGQALAVPMRHRDDVPHAYFSPDGQLLLTVSSDYSARIWDAHTGEPVTPPLVHEGPVLAGAWSPDGRQVVTCSDSGTAWVWDVSPNEESLSRLRRQVELLSAHRLEPNIGSVDLSAPEMEERWRERTSP